MGMKEREDEREGKEGEAGRMEERRKEREDGREGKEGEGG